MKEKELRFRYLQKYLDDHSSLYEIYENVYDHKLGNRKQLNATWIR